jgi:hypothetical protein
VQRGPEDLDEQARLDEAGDLAQRVEQCPERLAQRRRGGQVGKRESGAEAEHRVVDRGVALGEAT